MSGVTKIAARTPEDLGSTKIDATAVVNEKSQATAPQYNRLADYVIELQTVVGTAVDPAPGSITQRLDAVSDPNKIYDDAGTTRFETEEEADKATVTANGQRVFTMGEDRTDWEAAPDPVTGNTTTEATGAGAYAPGATGKYIAIRNALNELIGHLAMLRSGPGEGLALLRIMHEASVDSGAGLESLLKADDGAESVLKARSVLGRGALVELFADDTGVVSAQLKGEGLTSSARVVATDESVYFEGHGSAPIHLNEAGHEALPVGMTSLVQGLSLLASLLNGKGLDAGTWNPTPSSLINVSSITVPSPGGYLRVGNFVVCWLNLGVTPTAASATTTFRLPPPIASVMTTNYDAAGAFVGVSIGSNARVRSASSSNEIFITWTSSSSAGEHTLICGYEVKS